jgi:hypothetical protein
MAEQPGKVRSLTTKGRPVDDGPTRYAWVGAAVTCILGVSVMFFLYKIVALFVAC